MIREQCSWLNLDSDSGLSLAFKRLGISYKRGRDYVHSPDENYDEKALIIEVALQKARQQEGCVLLYEDELTYYRQPTLTRSWEVRGNLQPLAKRSYSSDTKGRIAAVMNAINGQVNYIQKSRTTIPAIAKFWYDIRYAYPNAEEIGIVVDNWPVHFHPDVLAPLQPQQFPYRPKMPSNWPTEPTGRIKDDNLPIRLYCLPTYASWLNPIEKLWRWLKQEVIHLHDSSNDWKGLQKQVSGFLDQFSGNSPDLLKYVGLLPN